MLAATIVVVASAVSAQAQTGGVAGIKPKPVTTVPIRPALQTPADTASAMAQAERQAIQSDLVWVGHYNGAINGDVSDRMVAGIKAFQKDRGAKQTGVLNPQERGVLSEAAKKRQDNVGWKIVFDAGTGVRLGVPAKLVPTQSSDANGAKWSSTTGTIQIQMAQRKEANPTTAKLAEQEKKEPTGRRIDYSAIKPDFFVLSGMQGLKKFYLRGQIKGNEVRILTILYDQATEGTMEPVVIAMSSAFNPFPNGPQAGPPPRKTVEYGTGVVVSDDGAIVTDRGVVDGCLSIVVVGPNLSSIGNADRTAEDKEHDLALLRLYGARGLKALALNAGAAKSSVELTGIADPQNQGGAAAVSSVKASTTGSELALTPAPGLGFSGSAALDADGVFAGVALLKPVVVAGPTMTAAATQASLVSADIVREFLKGNSIVAASGSPDAKASVVRVICVRK
jgi:peptidoglycan hydrolase-like protein with peptidoglycan-binding domain